MAEQYTYIAETGVIVPDTGDVLAAVEGEYKATLGQDLVATPNTPQGVMITAETITRSEMLRNNAALANQINPNEAGGIFLDGIWALTGGGRRAATKSTIDGVQLNGQAGTLVPAGSVASTAAGVLFESASDVVLSPGGIAYVNFIAVEYGPAAVNAATLVQIVSNVLGWETVTNANPAVLGANVESDAAARIRRRNTLSLQNVALPEAITSALYEVEGVQSLTFRENVTDATIVIDGLNIVEHSIYVCVNGGTDADVAAALFANKSLGCGWNGGTTVNITSNGQLYAVKFDRPTAVPMVIRVTVKQGTAVGDPTTLVKNAVLAYVNGLVDGEAGFVVGGAVSPFELSGAINIQATGLYVKLLEISKVTPLAYVTTEIAMLINQLPTLSGANINVVVVA